MDRREKVLDAIGEVGSDLIFEAETRRFAPSPLRRWGGLAAALVLAVGLMALALPWLQNGSPNAATEAVSDADQVQQTPDATLPEETETERAEEEAVDTGTDTAADGAEDSASPSDDSDEIAAGPQQHASWSLSLPSYDDAKELWESGRGAQLLTNFVTTLEAGCPDPQDPLLNFYDGVELDSLDLIRFFRLILNQQKGNGWYSGPSYEERWFEAQTDLAADSPYSAQGGWYDIPVSEIRSVLNSWLIDYQLDTAQLSDVIVEENTVRFDTLTGLGSSVHLQLEDAYFDDETQTMMLLVARYTDASLETMAAYRYYYLKFEDGLVRYRAILTE